MNTHFDQINNPEPKILRFDTDARQRIFEWQRMLTDQCNQSQKDSIRSMYNKMEVYAIRMALCMEMAKYACGESDANAISIDSIEGAIKLVEYFTNTALKTQSMVSEINPADNLPLNKKNLYLALPDMFKTNEGVVIAESLKISERTFKEFIKDKILFNYLKRGEYQKKFPSTNQSQPTV